MPSVGSDIHSARGIVGHVFCGQCGYDLHTRPIIGRCPECGGEYDTRPQAMRGIFLPQDVRFPASPFLLALYSAIVGAPCVYLAIKHKSGFAAFLGITFSVFCFFFVWIGVRKATLYVRYRLLLREVNRNESDHS